MDPILFEQLELQPDSQYFIYAGEIKALGLNHFYKEALRRSVHELGLSSGHRVFVAQEFGATGVGSGVVCEMDDLAPCVGDPEGVYVASCFILHHHGVLLHPGADATGRFTQLN